MTQLAAGNPAPLGARYDGKGVNFTLFSAHADRVELCVFDEKGIEHRYDLVGRSLTRPSCCSTPVRIRLKAR